ncbi:MAG: glycosyltransferase [Cyanobacteriota bacterium]|nr:glycosyltransferase [Cyanobacteriota bacterium]
MPLISAIVPAYNAEKTIRETIDSVIAQTHTDWELIVINDGSTDDTLKVLEQIDEPRMKVFSFENAGVAATRNRGIDRATGEYIAFLDSDDLWTPEKLEAQLAALNTNPKAAVAYSWTNYIDESGNVLGACAHADLQGDIYQILLLADFIGSGSNPLIKASALAEVGKFNPDVVPTEDWDMWLRLAAKYDYAVVPSVQVLYRQLVGSGSHNIAKMEVASTRTLNLAFQDAPESLRYLEPFCWGNRYKCFAWKALEGKPERQRAIMGAKFLWRAIGYDVRLWQQRATWKMWLKVLLALLLPSSVTGPLFAKMGRFANVDGVLQTLQYPVRPEASPRAANASMPLSQV